jgi:4-amino-4-deoxy-L-arabinose transferase-like glycosyltransferase
VAFLAAGVVYTLTFGHDYETPSGDGAAYERSAVQLLQKGFYGYKDTKPNAYMSPGYPLFLAGIYQLSGHVWSGRPRLILSLIQLLIATGTLFGVFLIGRRLFGDRVGLISATLFALYPPNIIATNLWLTETLATALIVWFVYVSLVALDEDGWWRWALAGALLGAAALVRPGVLPIALAPLLVWLLRGERKRVAVAAVTTAATCALVMAPWAVRNEMVLHKPYPLSSHSGDPMLAGVDPYYYERDPVRYEFHGPSYERWSSTDSPYTKNEYANRIFLSQLSSHPLQTGWWFTVGKTVRMYSVNWLAETGYVGSWSTALRMFLVVLGWLGVAFALREPRLRMVALVLALGTAAQLTVSPEPRYAFSWLVLLTIPAAVMLLRVFGPEPATIRVRVRRDE